ncbi:MAG TPA: hypothetical protein VFO73_06085 [Candidatus Limnocylindrales bacterium]|nr:hypothetical protein [Candidatus Limnocylindrales bacterium]
MRRLSTVTLAVALLAGCGASGASPSPPAGFSLRAWVTQAIEPVAGFGMGGSSVAISEGQVIVPGPIPAIFPGPILPNLQQRSISPNGIDAIVAAARAAGLLDGPTDLIGAPLPGAATGHLLFVIDGVEREVVGRTDSQIVCITTPCEAPPGTPEAFGGFWSLLSNLDAWIPGELGAQTPYDPERLAILLTEPAVDATLPPTSAPWPLEGPMSKFGVVFATPQGLPPVRCGVVEGDELAAALLAFRNGNGLTRWVDAEGDERGVQVRALVPGEPDPCVPGVQG